MEPNQRGKLLGIHLERLLDAPEHGDVLFPGVGWELGPEERSQRSLESIHVLILSLSVCLPLGRIIELLLKVLEDLRSSRPLQHGLGLVELGNHE